jgi:hypothetical protein
MKSVLWLFLAFFFASLLLTQPASPQQAGMAPVAEVLDWVKNPPKSLVEYDYVMTARVRLLFFWVGKDDVGGGYIRRGISSEAPREEMFQVLFGSDPARAPRAINRWGAGTEILWHKSPAVSPAKNDDVVASAFFGFMKSSRGKSASEMQQELKKEKDQGTHLFTGILSRVGNGQATSLVVPLQSQTDYNLYQYDQAQPIMLDRIRDSGASGRTLQPPPACPRAGEFLGTVSMLLDGALGGQQVPASLCYVYDAQENTLTVEHTEIIDKLPVQLRGADGATLVDTEYEKLLKADFVSTHRLTGKKVYFTIVAGTQGAVRGVPVQIRYQPNWWFQVVLNLRKSPVERVSTAAK